MQEKSIPTGLIWLTVLTAVGGCLPVESSSDEPASYCRPVPSDVSDVLRTDGGSAQDVGSDTAPKTPADPSPGNDNYVVVSFTNAAHRATLTEDGLEYVMSDGPWAIYRVTSATPRIRIPGTIEPDHSFAERHRTALCISSQYFTADAESASTHVKLMGSVGGSDTPTQLVLRGASAYDFGQCTGATDMRTEPDGTQPVTDMFIELDPAPPTGSLVPLMMVAIGSYDSALDLPHPNEQWEICCPDGNGCEAQEPPGWSDSPADPPPNTEPPEDSTPPQDEPPGFSTPPSPCPPGYTDTRGE